MQVRWGSCLSDSFLVSNGVRQGSILSPHLFAVYLDGLLIDLQMHSCYQSNTELKMLTSALNLSFVTHAQLVVGICDKLLRITREEF